MPKHGELGHREPLARVLRSVVRTPWDNAGSTGRLDLQSPLGLELLLEVLQNADGTSYGRTRSKQIVHIRAHSEGLPVSRETAIFIIRKN